MRGIPKFVLSVTFVAMLATAFAGCRSNYKLSTSSSPSGGGGISPASGTYERRVSVNITASPAPGYRFDHWEEGASGTSPTVQVMMDSDRNLAAYFTKVYTLSVTASPGNGGSVSPNSGTYDAGKQVTLTAALAQYYKFNGWGGDSSGQSNSLTVTMDSNKVIVAS